MFKNVRYGMKKLIAGVTLLSFEILTLLIMFTAALLSFFLIVKMVFSQRKVDFDLKAFHYLSKHVSSVNNGLMEFFTFLGTHLFLIPANILLIAYFLLIKKHRWYSIKIPVVAISSLILMLFLKLFFHRSRPESPLLQTAEGYSFPSGHALMSVTFYGLLIVLIWENVANKFLKYLLTFLLGFLIIAVGVSRVYLRVHYASDVLAGFCLGFIWLMLALLILQKLEQYSRRKIDPGIRYTMRPEDQKIM